MMTGIELVNQVAAEHGVTGLSDDDAAHILWEYTGYPSAFVGEPEEYFRRQLHEHFLKNRHG